MKVLRFLLKLLSFVPALMIMYMIYSFSAQDANESSNLSQGVSYKAILIVDQKLDLGLTDKQITRCINKIHHYVRKIAHFSEYSFVRIRCQGDMACTCSLCILCGFCLLGRVPPVVCKWA
jgi:hypothetical protein